jgi:hypothetical protein
LLWEETLLLPLLLLLLLFCSHYCFPTDAAATSILHNWRQRRCATIEQTLWNSGAGWIAAIKVNFCKLRMELCCVSPDMDKVSRGRTTCQRQIACTRSIRHESVNTWACPHTEVISVACSLSLSLSLSRSRSLMLSGFSNKQENCGKRRECGMRLALSWE